MEKVLLVGAGGFVGSVARYLMSGGAHRLMPAAEFPVGTLSVNLLGCFLIGLIAGVAESRSLFSPELRTLLLIGVLGGFTTFSTFAYETLALASDGEMVKAAGNVILQVVGCLIAAGAGMMVARSW